MKKIYIICSVLIALVWYSCKKEDRLDYIDSKAPAPAQISNVTVLPNPGGAKLTYKLPADPNMAYVKAVYEIQPGVFREAKSSLYTDTISLVGFGDTKSHEVKLYSVGKNEKASAPVIVNVVPLQPPVMSVFSSINMDATFGGVIIDFRNEHKANLALVVMVDSTGKDTWAPVTTFYTGAAEGRFAVRGFASEEKRFRVFVRDRWSNKSDTLTKSLTPKFEIEIPKNTWIALNYPGDTYDQAEARYKIEALWDKSIAANNGYASKNSAILPGWFTFDLGKTVFISRFKAHQFPTTHLYAGSAVKTFELWGSNNPDPDGGWTNWQLLGRFNSFKPSGLPMGQVTAEDKNYANFLGEEFNFETPPPPVRYLRWKTLETYSSTGQVTIGEIDIFGDIKP